ncbi:unnamed protein product [Ectocarpus sp. 4 AP-2014]|uniref:EsV-1-220 n=1 Tax=Ectocarpus siliculosus virus 1 (isolate New Zealand/Kaikoura/1988) TaxID=654926 RepID=Q8QN70_ESV1K|nr:EsV-1-220 [Ectocarpus siliculosus virus 1]AAK14634.1 EsV-1-220 [Ectocarpus siliculosus virus 1]
MVRSFFSLVVIAIGRYFESFFIAMLCCQEQINIRMRTFRYSYTFWSWTWTTAPSAPSSKALFPKVAYVRGSITTKPFAASEGSCRVHN